jgi:hypothetical protein
MLMDTSKIEKTVLMRNAFYDIGLEVFQVINYRVTILYQLTQHQHHWQIGLPSSSERYQKGTSKFSEWSHLSHAWKKKGHYITLHYITVSVDSLHRSTAFYMLIVFPQFNLNISPTQIIIIIIISSSCQLLGQVAWYGLIFSSQIFIGCLISVLLADNI